MNQPQETTTPEQRAAGRRSFLVTLDAHHQVNVQVSHVRDAACGGDPLRLEPAVDLLGNHDLAIALIRIANVAVNRIGSRL